MDSVSLLLQGRDSNTTFVLKSLTWRDIHLICLTQTDEASYCISCGLHLECNFELNKDLFPPPLILELHKEGFTSQPFSAMMGM